MAVLNLAILFAMIVGLAYFEAPIIVWTLLIATTLSLITFFGKLPLLLLTCCWILFFIVASFANLKKLRQKYITYPLINKLKKQMPAISDTEREAIEAGNVWWEKELLSGRPHWKKLLKLPIPKLTAEEQAFLDNQVETLCSMLNDWQIMNHDRDLPKDVWDFLKKERFFGLVIPKKYGGRGFSAFAHSTIIVKIATRSVSAAVNTMVPNSLGPGELLLHYGTEDQKDYYLPRLARGEDIPCFALTGPEAGSDAGSITDSGRVCYGDYQGKFVLGIRLTWDKRYITLAPIATLLGIAFRLYDPDNLLGTEKELGITLCLIPTSHPGVEIGNRHWPLYTAFMNGPTYGKEVFIPLEWVIGGPEKVGQGWKMLMECLSIGRAISLPALSTACAKLAYRATGAYSRLRRQFNTSIASFEGIEEALGNIAGLTYITEACRILTAGAVDLNIKPAIASAVAKYHMTEMARKIIDHAMDVHAGHAIQIGPRNVLAAAHLSMPISITVEGANILTRNLIIFGQGAIRCHPYLLQEITLFSAEDNLSNRKALDKLLVSHMGYTISNFVRTLWTGLTGGKFIFTPGRGSIAHYYRQLTRMSFALALLSDSCFLLLGGSLKRKERLSARLGDILSHLYLASSVLKYFNDQGKPVSDLNYIKWCVEHCLHHIQVAIDELLHNFPTPWIGKALRWIIFPFGTAYRKPRDHVYHHIVKSMISPSDLRDRITRHCFLGQGPDDPINRLDIAFSQLRDVEPIWKKLHVLKQQNAIPRYINLEEQMQHALKTGSLTEEEINALRQFDRLHKEVIKVNEFSFDLNTVVS